MNGIHLEMAAATEVCNVLVRRVSATDYRSVIDLFKVSLLASVVGNGTKT